MKHIARDHRGTYKLLVEGARSISLMPSVRDCPSRVAKNGVASDWKKVGGDMRSAMKKFELERAR